MPQQLLKQTVLTLKHAGRPPTLELCWGPCVPSWRLGLPKPCSARHSCWWPRCALHAHSGSFVFSLTLPVASWGSQHLIWGAAGPSSLYLVLCIAALQCTLRSEARCELSTSSHVHWQGVFSSVSRALAAMAAQQIDTP